MSFTNPVALFGLLTLPYFLWLGRPRNWARSRAILSMILRGLIIILLVLGLSGLQIVRAADQLAVVFLIDASDSMPPRTIEAARTFAQEAVTHMRPDDQAAIIVFGSDALVERPMSPTKEVGPLESEVLPLNTDMAEAIRLGMALFPPGAARRIVILSDGLANVGDAEEAARLAAASGVQIVALPFAALSGAEVLVTDVEVPTRLNENQVFDLTVTLESSVETEAILRITSGGQVLVDQGVALVEGLNRYSFTLEAPGPGLASFRVQVIPAGEDIFYQNNELAAFTQVVGPPRVLIVGDDEREYANLADALLAQGLLVDQVNSAAFPPDLATLSNYGTVVLVNVPARNLGPTNMQAIQTYVRDLGGGLVTVGGPNTYGPGGYFQTPLEETLPVDMQLKDQERLPQLTVVYVIDKSGSMSDTSVGGIPKVELAKEAIIRSVALLGPLDRVGVVAFDENGQWVVDLGPIRDRNQIALQVGTIRASGGTDIYAGLLTVSNVLPNDPGQLRHIVLLTDGGASPEGIPELVQELYDEHGITLSVIAIGQGYADFVEDLPALADGRFHYAYNVDTIPEIFTEETVIATRAYTIEGEFFPALTASSPIMTGISGTPSLLGYIGTSIKPTAQQILVTDKDDPLLAAWQYGLGRSVAWTSDATGRWGINWLGWEQYARFWSQAVRWTISDTSAQNVEVRVFQEGEQVRVIVDALDEDGSFLNGLDLVANVVGPDLDTEPIVLSQVAPGQYEGIFEPGDEGAYFVRVAGGAGEEAVIGQTSGWVLAYSPEYRSFQGDPDYLGFISGLTGGSVIEDASTVFVHNIRVEAASQPIWPSLLLFATLLLPFDIAVRRLVITRRDLLQLRARLFPGLPEPAAPRESRAGALFAAKERASERVAAQDQATRGATSTASNLLQRKQGSGAEEAIQAPAHTQVSPPASPASPPKSAPRQSGRGTASALLRSKRERQGEDEDG